MNRGRSLPFLFLIISVLFLILPKPALSAFFVFKDDFNSAALNTSFWQPFLVSTGVTTSQEEGGLRIRFDGTTDPGSQVFGAGVSSLCKLHGDFDIQVDYRLGTWPGTNGVRVGIAGGSGGFSNSTAAVERVSFGPNDASTAGRELYLTQAAQGSIVGGADTLQFSGTMRLVRAGDSGSAYFLEGESWIPIGTFTSTLADVAIMLASWSHDYLFIHQPVDLVFDNLIVNSGTFINCSFPTSAPTPTTVPTSTPTPQPTATPTPAVVIFKQNDPQWKDKQYAFETGRCSTIEKCGCALTSVAMVLNYHGAVKDPNGNPTTPETVNEYFKKGPKCKTDGCTSLGYWYGQVRWDAVNQYSKDAYDKFGTQKIVWNGMSSYSPATVTSDLSQNNPAILKVLQNTHWAVATGIDGNTFSLNDPAHNHTKLSDSPYNNTAFAVEHYQKTSSDFSSFEAVAKSPAKLLVTDPDGKQTGFDPQLNSVKQDIPNSYYSFEGAINDDTGAAPPPGSDEGVNTVIVSVPKPGKYKVKVIAIPGSLYSFAVYGSSRDAGLAYDLFEATPSSQIYNEYDYAYSPEPGTTQLFQNVTIDIRPLINRNDIFCRNKLEIIPVALFSSNTFATDDVDLASIRFEGAPIMTLGGKLKLVIDKIDINRDGKKDLIMTFKLSDTKLTCQATNATLTGKTKNGSDFKGSDNIRMIK